VGRGDALGRTDRISLALVGASQEGKTSVALRLLGVDSEWLPRVEHALRGGREIGRSSTPVVTVYEASELPPSDEALEDLSSKIRDARKNRPEFLFLRVPAARGCVARLVDLVGVEAADGEEEEIARRRATEWLYQADVHVFVSGMDHISNLVKTHDPSVARILHFWQVNADTSLVVLTKAYETGEAMKELSGAEEPAVLLAAARDRCRRILSAELSRGRGSPFPMERLPQILPVCLKNSQEPHVVLAQKATMLALQDIERLAEKDPIRFRVRAGFSLPRVLLRELREVEEEEREWREKFERDLAGLDDETREVSAEVVSRNEILQGLRGELERLRDEGGRLKAIAGAEEAQSLRERIEAIRSELVESRALHDWHKWRDFGRAADQYAEKVEEVIRTFVSESRTKLQSASPGIPEEALAGLTTVLRENLRRYETEIPELRKTVCFFFDKEETMKAVLDWSRRFRDSVVGVFGKAVSQTVRTELARTRTDRAREERRVHMHAAEIEGALHKDESRLQTLAARREAFVVQGKETENALVRRVAVATRAVKESHRYSAILQKHFIDEWKRLVRLASEAPDADSVLSGLASMCVLSETLSQVAVMEKGGRLCGTR